MSRYDPTDFAWGLIGPLLPSRRCDGRGDELAVVAVLLQESCGFSVERGATIIQSDESRAAIAWLEGHGYRQPYGDPPAPSIAAAPSN